MREATLGSACASRAIEIFSSCDYFMSQRLAHASPRDAQGHQMPLVNEVMFAAFQRDIRLIKYQHSRLCPQQQLFQHEICRYLGYIHLFYCLL